MGHQSGRILKSISLQVERDPVISACIVSPVISFCGGQLGLLDAIPSALGRMENEIRRDAQAISASVIAAEILVALLTARFFVVVHDLVHRVSLLGVSRS